MDCVVCTGGLCTRSIRTDTLCKKIISVSELIHDRGSMHAINAQLVISYDLKLSVITSHVTIVICHMTGGKGAGR